jgi:RHS repeat-associated protein
VVSVADANGGLIDSAGRGFDPFGKPREDDWRDSDGQNGETPTQPGDLNRNDLTTRGFTGHEHLNETDLIHMNGRVYDCNLGRFLSVDPFIQFPENSQSMNAYSYILNNPLSGTDPTGYTTEAPDASQSGTGASSGGNSAADQAKARVRKTAPTGSNIKSQTRITASGGSAEFSSSGEFLSGSGDLGALMNTLHASGNGGSGAPTINMGNGEGNADIGSPNSGGNESGNSPNAQMDATGCQVPLRCGGFNLDIPAGENLLEGGVPAVSIGVLDVLGAVAVGAAVLSPVDGPVLDAAAMAAFGARAAKVFGALGLSMALTGDTSESVVISYRAPRVDQLLSDKVSGFTDHVGGLFLTISPEVATKWALIRGAGVYVFSTPRKAFNRLVNSGGIVSDPDPDFSAHSFIVVPGAIPEFINSSNVSYVPSSSKEFYDDFYSKH